MIRAHAAAERSTRSAVGVIHSIGLSPMKKVAIYTDGSCLGNPGPGGWCAVLKLEGTEYAREIGGGFRRTTNNRMEILAAIMGLGALNEPCEVRLHSDSQYLCNAVEKRWLYGWQKRDFKKKDGRPVPNADLWQRLLPQLQTHKVRFMWLRGHAGHEENERCDEVARAWAQSDDLPADEIYEALGKDCRDGGGR